MARGLGGDDGPSLWMFVAVVLVWGTIRSWFQAAKNNLDDVVSTNYANPVQGETTKDIKVYESAVKRVAVPWSSLPRQKDYYQRLAISHRQLMDTGGNMDEDALFAQVARLSANELKALYYCFGVADRSNGLMAIWTGDLFVWYEKGLDDWGIKPTELQRMRSIWAKTKLWT
jgi:hypothetical protein